MSRSPRSPPPTSSCRRPRKARPRSPRGSPRPAQVQTERYEGHGPRTNAEADGELLDKVATPDEPGRRLLAQAAEAMRLSARGYHRVLRVARTIADLAGASRSGASTSPRRSAIGDRRRGIEI